MKVKITSLDNKAGEEISLNDAIFGVDVREDILHRVVRWQLAKRQQGTHLARNKSEVGGTTKKPFNQKGTGNARQGDRKGPHMRGGSKAGAAPRVRSHAFDLPKKIRALGLKVALSYKAKSGDLLVFKDVALKEAKTADLKQKLDAMSLTSVLVIDGETIDNNFKLASANLHKINVLPTVGANVYDILRHQKLVLTVDGVKQLEKRLG